jgi:hypothetical protein
MLLHEWCEWRDLNPHSREAVKPSDFKSAGHDLLKPLYPLVCSEFTLPPKNLLYALLYALGF